MMQAVGMWLAAVLVDLGSMRLALAVVGTDRQSPERQTICPTVSLNPILHVLVPILSYGGNTSCIRANA